ncbi:hypothetical protein JXR93_04775 [bacterium]|nr:hypothetical protein [bacterium]
MKKFLVFLFLIMPFFAYSKVMDYKTVESSSALQGWHNSSNGLKFKPAKGWTYKGQNDMYVGADGSSINVQVEASALSMEDYISASLKEMRKSFPDYKLEQQLVHTINGKEAHELVGTFTYSNIKMKLKSIIFTKDASTKIVVTIGGLADNFNKNLDVFEKIQASIVFESSSATTTVAPTTSSSAGVFKDPAGKYSFWVPTGWNRSGDKTMFVSSKGSSVNLLTEVADMNLDDYGDLSLKNMKSQIPSYELIKREKKVINGVSTVVLYGKFNMYNNDLRIYSVIYDGGTTKYVLTLGGLDSNFDADNSNFLKSMESFKLNP